MEKNTTDAKELPLSTRISITQQNNPVLHKLLAGIKKNLRAQRMVDLMLLGATYERWMLDGAGIVSAVVKALPAIKEEGQLELTSVKANTVSEPTGVIDPAKPEFNPDMFGALNASMVDSDEEESK